MTFTLEMRGQELRFRQLQLHGRTWITPDYVRVRLTGDLTGFDSPGSDDHIRVFFPAGAAVSVDELRAAPSREYTPLAWDSAAGTLDVEFAVHGDDGVAAPWAATAEIGAAVGVGGPRGSRVLVGRPDAWFLAGDETAVPAIRRFTALMDAEATGRILIEVVDRAHEIPLEVPAGVDLAWVHRGDAAPAAALNTALAALGALDRPAGVVLGFVAAEQSIVKLGRALLLDRWALDPAQVVVKGYWKRGEPEYHAPH